jgi:hypothetical protein
LPAVLDLAALMTEALVLALPLYPRAPGAELGSAVFAEPGTAPMTDESARPFARLGLLKDAARRSARRRDPRLSPAAVRKTRQIAPCAPGESQYFPRFPVAPGWHGRPAGVWVHERQTKFAGTRATPPASDQRL